MHGLPEPLQQAPRSQGTAAAVAAADRRCCLLPATLPHALQGPGRPRVLGPRQAGRRHVPVRLALARHQAEWLDGAAVRAEGERQLPAWMRETPGGWTVKCALKRLRTGTVEPTRPLHFGRCGARLPTACPPTAPTSQPGAAATSATLWSRGPGRALRSGRLLGERIWGGTAGTALQPWLRSGCALALLPLAASCPSLHLKSSLCVASLFSDASWHHLSVLLNRTSADERGDPDLFGAHARLEGGGAC